MARKRSSQLVPKKPLRGHVVARADAGDDNAPLRMVPPIRPPNRQATHRNVVREAAGRKLSWVGPRTLPKSVERATGYSSATGLVAFPALEAHLTGHSLGWTNPLEGEGFLRLVPDVAARRLDRGPTLRLGSVFSRLARPVASIRLAPYATHCRSTGC